METYTALYSPLDRQYSQVMSGPYEDLSHEDGNGAVVAALKDGQITGFWRPVVIFGPDAYQRTHIERLWKTSRDIVYEDYLVDNHLSYASLFLLRQGYTAQPKYRQVIDVTQGEDELKRDMRKSYHSLVNKRQGVFHTMVRRFRDLHRQHRGTTRPDRTWEIQAEMNPLVVADIHHQCGVMFYFNRYSAYYASAAGPNVHACIWHALLTLKRYKVRMCDMGEQVFAGDGKLVSISQFKRGFGGRTELHLLLRKP